VQAFGIPPAYWNAVSDELIDRHATMWLALETNMTGKNIHVVDSRGATIRAATGTTGESNDWENEIHPTPAGYSLLAKKWRTQLDTLA